MNCQWVKDPLHLSAKYQRSQWTFPNVKKSPYFFKTSIFQRKWGKARIIFLILRIAGADFIFSILVEVYSVIGSFCVSWSIVKVYGGEWAEWMTGLSHLPSLVSEMRPCPSNCAWIINCHSGGLPKPGCTRIPLKNFVAVSEIFFFLCSLPIIENFTE